MDSEGSFGRFWRVFVGKINFPGSQRIADVFQR